MEMAIWLKTGLHMPIGRPGSTSTRPNLRQAAANAKGT